MPHNQLVFQQLFGGRPLQERTHTNTHGTEHPEALVSDTHTPDGEGGSTVDVKTTGEQASLSEKPKQKLTKLGSLFKQASMNSLSGLQ